MPRLSAVEAAAGSQARASERGRGALSGGDAADGRCDGLDALADTAEAPAPLIAGLLLASGGHAALDECGADMTATFAQRPPSPRAISVAAAVPESPAAGPKDAALPDRIMPAPLRMPLGARADRRAAPGR